MKMNDYIKEYISDYGVPPKSLHALQHRHSNRDSDFDNRNEVRISRKHSPIVRKRRWLDYSRQDDTMTRRSFYQKIEKPLIAMESSKDLKSAQFSYDKPPEQPRNETTIVEIVPPRSSQTRSPVSGRKPERKSNYGYKPTVKQMDWDNYHRLGVIHNFLDQLEQSFPSICTAGIIGKSLEGRDLKIIKISNSNAKNTAVWIDAGIHAREWIAPAVATYVANNIARSFDCSPTFITNKDWYFLPVMNPDGYEYSHTSERMWRKNRARQGRDVVGVDLNRNFSCGWGGKGSSKDPSAAFYKGPEPFSEPESTAVRDMLSSSGINFKVYITLHSYGQVIIFPFAHREDICPGYIRLLEGATVMSKAIYECNGNIYKVGVSKDVMYIASGTSNDWSYGEAKIPFCYLIELRSRKHKFTLPRDEIKETGDEILRCVKALMEFVDTYPLEKALKKEAKMAKSTVQSL